MSTTSASALSAADYDAIASAVMETSRGRWFLAEYARRNRHADTEMLLAALQRLENVVQTESISTVDRMRSGLIDMAGAIAKAKADIAALRPEDQQGRIEQATEELDSVVSATETATSEILAAAEQVQETAWTLREQGANPEQCDQLDGLATDIYTACSFQDLTGQRTRKVINLLRYLEGRIDAMIDLWGGRRPATEVLEPESRATGPDRRLLNGPPKAGEGLDQGDIDSMLFGAEGTGEMQAVKAELSLPTQPTTAMVAAGELDPAERDPLAPLKAMSEDERIALFT